MDTNELPATLLEAVRYFADPDVCREFVAAMRWPNGVECPRGGCGSTNVHFIETRKIWRCYGCKKQFSVKVGTIFEDSPIGLDKWLPAVWLLSGSKKGVSSYHVHRSLGVTQKTAWFMLHRIRLAMRTQSFNVVWELNLRAVTLGSLLHVLKVGPAVGILERLHHAQ